MDLGGLPVTLLDTAGLREAEDEVERIGVARALDRAGKADLRVFLMEGDERLEGLVPGDEDIVARAKADLVGSGDFGVSGVSGAGVPELIDRIGNALSNRVSGGSSFSRERHRAALNGAIMALRSVLQELQNGVRVDVVGEELRHAIRRLDSLVGRVDVEEVLGEIFGSFCIGK